MPFSAIAGTILAVDNPNTLDPRTLIERILNQESCLSGPVSLNKFTPVKPRQKPRQQNAAASSSSAPAPQGGVTCFYCQKPSHKANECKKKQKDLENAKKGKVGQKKSGQTAAGQGARANVVATTIGVVVLQSRRYMKYLKLPFTRARKNQSTLAETAIVTSCKISETQ
jgi:hypothetical protein